MGRALAATISTVHDIFELFCVRSCHSGNGIVTAWHATARIATTAVWDFDAHHGSQ